MNIPETMTTQRLSLRHFKDDETDLQAIYKIMSNKRVNRFLPWFPLTDINEAPTFYQTRIQPVYIPMRSCGSPKISW